MAVLEQGMEFPGEIHRLAAITRSDVAIITNIGISHLENLGTKKNIYRAKMEITDFFGENNVLIINESNDMLSKERILKECAGKYNVVSGFALLATGNCALDTCHISSTPWCFSKERAHAQLVL